MCDRSLGVVGRPAISVGSATGSITQHHGRVTLKASLASAAVAAAMLACAAPVAAQSTDGYHSLQVFPVVVDTASFAQQFNFTTPNLFPVTLKPVFYPGNDTPQAAVGPVTCPDIVIPANGNVGRNSLRTMC